MFCKASGLAAYLSIQLAAKTSLSSSCNCASCDFGFGRLTHSSFILVLTDTTFLLFFISHNDNTHIADSDAPNTHLLRNSFLILLICVQIPSFWHAFATLFSVSPIPFSPFVMYLQTYFTVAISLITYCRSTFPLCKDKMS